jgi:hypothetical protein
MSAVTVSPCAFHTVTAKDTSPEKACVARASQGIVTLAVLAITGLVSLVIWEWFYEHPVIDVRLYKNLNFLEANCMMFVLGVMLFASLVMMPLFLQSLMGYTAESAGWQSHRFSL